MQKSTADRKSARPRQNALLQFTSRIALSILWSSHIIGGKTQRQAHEKPQALPLTDKMCDPDCTVCNHAGETFSGTPRPCGSDAEKLRRILGPNLALRSAPRTALYMYRGLEQPPLGRAPALPSSHSRGRQMKQSTICLATVPKAAGSFGVLWPDLVQTVRGPGGLRLAEV